MPFLLKKISSSIVEQIPAKIYAISNIEVGIGYGGIYFELPGLIAITQNFDYVIATEEYPVLTYYGLKNNDYTELKISY